MFKTSMVMNIIAWDNVKRGRDWRGFWLGPIFKRSIWGYSY